MREHTRKKKAYRIAKGPEIEKPTKGAPEPAPQPDERPICSLQVGRLVAYLLTIPGANGARETVARLKFQAEEGGIVMVQLGTMDMLALERLCNAINTSSAVTIAHFPHVVTTPKEKG